MPAPSVRRGWRASALDLPDYDANPLLDAAGVALAVRNDAALARLLRMTPQNLSKIRHRRTPVHPRTLIRLHLLTGMPFAQMWPLLGVDADVVL